MAAPPNIPAYNVASVASPRPGETIRETFRDKESRVQALLADEAEACLAYGMGHRSEIIEGSGSEFRKEGGLFHNRTDRFVAKWHCFGSGVGGDLIDFCAHFRDEDGQHGK